MFATLSYSSRTPQLFGEYTLLSQCGLWQDDPLSMHLFSISQQPFVAQNKNIFYIFALERPRRA